MGQIVGGAAKPKRCNLNQLSQLGTPAAGEYILVSSDNSMNAAGQGNFDCYIVGDGTKAATVLLRHYISEERFHVIDENYTGLKIESGYFVNANTGVITAHTAASPYAIQNIPVIPNTTIQIQIQTCPLASGRGAAFYTNNGKYIATSISYVVGQLVYEVIVPSDAATLAITTFGTSSFRVVVKDIGLNNIFELVNDGKYDPHYTLSENDLIAGYFFNTSTHLLVRHASYSYYKIPFVAGTRLIVYPNFTNTTIGMGAFDEYGNYLGGAAYSETAIEFIVPENTKYVYITKYAQIVVYISAYLNSADVAMNGYRELDDKINKDTGPLDRIDLAPTHISMFKRIMHIGDSLTRGQYNTTSPNTNGADIPEYSRPVFMQRKCGNVNVNLGIGGASAAENANYNWLSVAQAGTIFSWSEFENAGDCYIIALGTNDIIALGSFTGDVSTDIDTSDYSNNAGTSVGSYAKIIQMVLELQPKAKIFCVTIPQSRNTAATRSEANTKIKAIAEMFGCYVIDLETYAENSNTINDFNTYFKNGSHNNALGYELRARQYISYIDWIIRNNLDDFRNVQFIGTNYDYEQS